MTKTLKTSGEDAADPQRRDAVFLCLLEDARQQPAKSDAQMRPVECDADAFRKDKAQVRPVECDADASRRDKARQRRVML